MSAPITILFLAANPKNTTQIRLGEEVRSIQEKLRASRYRDRFKVEQEWAVRVGDIQGHLLRHSPHIVHFSGHGSTSNEIILEDGNGNSQPVNNVALSQLFSIIKDNIRCVVLNACYTEQQAQMMAEHVDCVIGMSKAIGDNAAIAFSSAFYQALSFGKDIKTAFELGLVQINLENLGEQNTPKLIAKHTDPQQIFLSKSTVEDETQHFLAIAKSILNFDREQNAFYIKRVDEGYGNEVFDKDTGALTFKISGKDIEQTIREAVKNGKASLDINMEVEDRLGSPGYPDYMWWENNVKQYTGKAKISFEIENEIIKLSIELPHHFDKEWSGW